MTEALSPLYDAREVKAIIRLLLEEVCGMTYTQIVMAADDPLPEEQRRLLADYASCLATGEPVQQVMGYAWFRGRKFKVTPDVLIPRPETEELVDMVVENFANGAFVPVDNPMDKPVDNGSCSHVDNSVDKQVNKCYAPPVDNSVDSSVVNPLDNPIDNLMYNLVDIGTGSGCIALSLAADIHDSLVTAVDLSTDSLITAKDNANMLGINNVIFVQADILKEENDDFSTELSTIRCDAIVSNPPYICRKEAADMESHVLEHEPHLALFVSDDDPLIFYRVIGKYGLRHLKPGGKLYFEINAAYGKETCQLLCEQGYQQVSLIKDFTGRDRFVTATFHL